ncbi:MAG: hypothetical protein SPL41_00835, partial [Succinivibrionaceae bacterium]|nr:hypothetical protein [Succinivibrionaceae bacterium]
LDDRDMVIQTMNISSSKSSIPAERSMSGTSDHTENVIEPLKPRMIPALFHTKTSGFLAAACVGMRQL